MKMQARDLMIDFINFAMLLFIISFSIIFFTYKDNFETFMAIMRWFVPLSFFVMVLLIKSKLNRKEYQRRKTDNNLEIVLRLNFFHKAMLDIILYASPVIIIGIALLKDLPDYVDVMQALITFLLLYSWQKYMFSKDSF